MADMVPTLDKPAPASDLSPRDREWLTLYLDSGEDPRVLAENAGISLIESITWLASQPIRRALAAWDHAQRRARAVIDEADRRFAIDALKATCQRQLAASHRSHPSHETLDSGPRTRDSGPAPPDHAALTEVRRAATTILRTLNGGMALRPVSRRHAGPPRHRKPRRVSDFTFSDPAEAERLLEKERRENDRLANLIRQATDLADTVSHPIAVPAITPEPSALPADAPPASPRSVSAIASDLDRLFASPARSPAGRLAAGAGRVTAPPNTS